MRYSVSTMKAPQGASRKNGFNFRVLALSGALRQLSQRESSWQYDKVSGSAKGSLPDWGSFFRRRGRRPCCSSLQNHQTTFFSALFQKRLSGVEKCKSHRELGGMYDVSQIFCTNSGMYRGQLAKRTPEIYNKAVRCPTENGREKRVFGR